MCFTLCCKVVASRKGKLTVSPGQQVLDQLPDADALTDCVSCFHRPPSSQDVESLGKATNEDR